MVSLLVGDGDNPSDAIDACKASELTELRNWAARRAMHDPDLSDDVWPLFVERMAPGEVYAADEAEPLVGELLALEAAALVNADYVPEEAWMAVAFRQIRAGASAAARAGETLEVR